MQLVIPMSGLGNRFKRAGYADPKPLIPVDGKPIIAHVLDMFPDRSDLKIIFICNALHLRETALREVLLGLAPSATIVEVASHEPKGPVYDIYMAREHSDVNHGVIVNYCDIFQVWNYADFVETATRLRCDGAIPCYTGFHPHLLGPGFYAGCRVDHDMKLLEIREKHSFETNKMDGYHSSGTYYFRSGALMKKYFKEMLDTNVTVNSEYYVSMAYSLMLRDALFSLVYPVPFFCQWGTPEDLAEYQYWSRYFLNPRT